MFIVRTCSGFHHIQFCVKHSIVMSGKQFSPPVKRFYGKKTEDILDFVYIFPSNLFCKWFASRSRGSWFLQRSFDPNNGKQGFHCRHYQQHFFFFFFLFLITQLHYFTNNISYYVHLFIKAKTFLILAMDQKLQKHRKNSGGISLMGVN